MPKFLEAKHNYFHGKLRIKPQLSQRQEQLADVFDETVVVRHGRMEVRSGPFPRLVCRTRCRCIPLESIDPSSIGANLPCTKPERNGSDRTR